MGDRANVCVREDEQDRGVYLYTHWDGSNLPQTLRDALAKEWRWQDIQYLTRIIFDEMTKDEHGTETGYGISSAVGDGEDRVLIVDGATQTVSKRGSERKWTFDEYVHLTDAEVESVW